MATAARPLCLFMGLDGAGRHALNPCQQLSLGTANPHAVMCHPKPPLGPYSPGLVGAAGISRAGQGLPAHVGGGGRLAHAHELAGHGQGLHGLIALGAVQGGQGGLGRDELGEAVAVACGGGGGGKEAGRRAEGASGGVLAGVEMYLDVEVGLQGARRQIAVQSMWLNMHHDHLCGRCSPPTTSWRRAQAHAHAHGNRAALHSPVHLPTLKSLGVAFRSLFQSILKVLAKVFTPKLTCGARGRQTHSQANASVPGSMRCGGLRRWAWRALTARAVWLRAGVCMERANDAPCQSRCHPRSSSLLRRCLQLPEHPSWPHRQLPWPHHRPQPGAPSGWCRWGRRARPGRTPGRAAQVLRCSAS